VQLHSSRVICDERAYFLLSCWPQNDNDYNFSFPLDFGLAQLSTYKVMISALGAKSCSVIMCSTTAKELNLTPWQLLIFK
jgi:hypothetical protein